MTFYYDPKGSYIYGTFHCNFRSREFEGPEELLVLRRQWVTSVVWSKQEAEIEDRMLVLLPPEAALYFRRVRSNRYWSRHQ